MSTPSQADRSPERVMREWFGKLWNEGAGRDMIDFVLWLPGARSTGSASQSRDRRGSKPFYQQFRSAFPDVKVEIEQVVVEGDKVAAHCRVKGKHTGHTLGGAATNREVEFVGLVMARVVDGKVVECWNVFDFLGMYQQMSWVKMPVMP